MKEFNIPLKVQIKPFKHHKKLKSLILNGINNQTDYEELVGSGNNITKVDWNTSRFRQDRPWVLDFINPLSEHMFEWFPDYGYNSFQIAEMWFQQYDKNSWHNWHVHGCNYTGVYYLDLPNDSSNTQYLDPGNFETIKEFVINEGDILLFPSIVVHRSPPNKSTERKTIISWNFNITIPDGIQIKETP